MLLLIASNFFIAGTTHLSFGAGWDPSKFLYDPGPNYELVWKEDFENVGPVKAIINGAPVYAPDPKNWTLKTGVTNGSQLTIIAMKEGYTSAILSSVHLQQFIFEKFAAIIRLPYGQGMSPAWWIMAWIT